MCSVTAGVDINDLYFRFQHEPLLGDAASMTEIRADQSGEAFLTRVGMGRDAAPVSISGCRIVLWNAVASRLPGQLQVRRPDMARRGRLRRPTLAGHVFHATRPAYFALAK